MRRDLPGVVLLLLVVMLPGIAGAATVERTGYAYDLKGKGTLLYTEHHEEQMENGRVIRCTVTYLDAEGREIAVKKLDFSNHPTSPEFRLEGLSNGHVEGAERQGGKFTVFFRKSTGNEYVEETVPLPDRAIIDGGFDRFVERNWEALLSGKVFERPFLVPSFQKFVDFKIYLDHATDENAVFVMETASFLLRILSDKILVTYNRDNGALRRYEGISNIRDQDGENYDVRVEFPAAGDTGDTASSE